MLWHYYASCQQCLLEKGRVAGITITGFFKEGLSLKLNASKHDFIRVERFCTSDDCKGLKVQLLPPSGLAVQLDIPKGKSGDTRTIGIRQRERRNICLAQPPFKYKNDCSECWRQNSESKSIEEFRIATDEKYKILSVLHTKHPKNLVAQACRATGLCEYLETDAISDDEYEAVYNPQVSTNYGVALPGIENSIVGRIPHVTSNEFGQSVPTASGKLQCVKLTMHMEKYRGYDTFDQIMGGYMRRLSQTHNDENLHVHWLTLYEKHPEHALFLLWSDAIFMLTHPDNEGPENFEETNLQECYNAYHEQFDASPIGDQILMHASTTIVTRDHYSNCVLAYHDELDPCHGCLNSAAKRLARFSEITLLADIKINQKPNLGNCISISEHTACRKLVYIPNEVWAHDARKSKQKRWYHKVSKFVVGTTSQMSMFRRIPSTSATAVTLVLAKFD